MVSTYRRALIIGTGPGLSASIAHAFADSGMKIALAARNPAKLKDLVYATRAQAFACDASDPWSVDQLFAEVEKVWGEAPDVLVYNASGRVRGAFTSLDRDEVRKAWHANLRPRAFMWRISSLMAALDPLAAPMRRCLILTLSQGPICTCCSKTVAHGHGKLS